MTHVSLDLRRPVEWPSTDPVQYQGRSFTARTESRELGDGRCLAIFVLSFSALLAVAGGIAWGVGGSEYASTGKYALIVGGAIFGLAGLSAWNMSAWK